MSTSFETRLQTAAEILDPYFSKANVNVDSKSFITQTLESMGIDDTKIGIETLNISTLEDFEAALGSVVEKLPQPRLRLAWNTIKEAKEESKFQEVSSLSSLIQTIKPVGQWTDLELLEKYGKDCPSEIEDILRRRCKERHCIIFFEDGSVDVENSLYMFRKARFQETPSTIMIKDQMRQVYKVGEFPLDVLFECPIHKNVLLVDGYCEECGVTFDTQNSEKLALLRLIREGTTTDPIIYKSMDFGQLSKEFPKIMIKFRELKDEDKLPSLKRRVSRVKDGDPFRVSSHRTY